jgi:transposase
VEATENGQWFVELVNRLGHELWIGDAAKIRASDVRQQKRDRRSPRLLVQFLAEGRFPRISVPSPPHRRRAVGPREKIQVLT